MKLIRGIIFLVLLNCALYSSAQLVVKISFQFKQFVGHSVTMYFSVKNIESINDYTNAICNVDTIKERFILTNLGIPIVVDKIHESQCKNVANIKMNLDSLLDCKYTQNIYLDNSAISFSLSVLQAKYDFCVFDLTSKYWSSYDANFRKALIITSNPIIEKISRKESRMLKKISRKLSCILKKHTENINE